MNKEGYQMDWFRRHLHWTFGLGHLGLLLVYLILYITILGFGIGASSSTSWSLESSILKLHSWDQYITPQGLDVTSEQYSEYKRDLQAYQDLLSSYTSELESIYFIIAIPLSVVAELLLGIYVLRHKGRSLWNLFWLFAGLIGLFVFLGLGNRKEGQILDLKPQI